MKVSFNSESLKKLGHYIERNAYLRQIDLSWNELSCVQYPPILQAMAENQNLTEINLSHNQIYDARRFLSKRRQDDFEKNTIERLQAILADNQFLMHLFLNQCGLSLRIVEALIP